MSDVPNTLGYQNSEQARREKATDWRRRIFGVSMADAWAALANEINARHEPGRWLRGSRVVASVGPWRLTLDTVQHDENNVFTRLRAPFVNPGGFRFLVYRATIFTGLGKALGMQDIAVGDPAFDEPFVVQGNDDGRVRELLADPELRRLIALERHFRLEVKDDEGWFGTTYPAEVDELVFLAGGVIKDVDRLRRMFDLFARTLQRLCEIGEATSQPPGVEL